MHTFRVSLFASFISGLIFTTAVTAEVRHAADDGFVISNKAMTNASPQEVWQALTGQVDEWWPKDHTWWRGTLSIDTQAGGCFCEQHNDNSATHMHISQVAPPHKLVMTGGLGPLQAMGVNGALVWSITKKEAGTEVALTYRVHGYAPPDGLTTLAPVVDQVQAQQLASLIHFVTSDSGE
ncbi:SRPBCC domain-containing protein [Alteromonas sp. ASW11-19]|uniref:SRPBCC domain-containing protein n=1 Tax=Alteromonas salexigens TaxID=2982530 RepID=A0ABT2VLX6_9ALTE|nr:SRPBCC domain-containing protein [Alteromonas salexigens]MCU7554328.1 SRPBCC domain-containing protein [Alteromonas salexigens]